MSNSCPICWESPRSWFVSHCYHSWCSNCHQKMKKHSITKCPLCRAPWYEKIPNLYIEFLLEGGEPTVKWRNKRYYKKNRRACIFNI